VLRKMRRIELIIFAFIFGVFLISAVSAEIMISQPKALYNIGEELDLNVKVSEGGEPISANLICENGGKSILFKNLKPDEKTIDIFQPLTKSFLGNMEGICNLNVEYGAEQTLSQDFRISIVGLLIISPKTHYLYLLQDLQ